MIEVRNLSKRYGDKQAVSGISFDVQPGKVTGFLGPNGAGKSTTMRMMVGLDKPTGGAVSINGKQYNQLHAPLREIGALLDAKGVHTSRSARNHLLSLAATHGIEKSRIDEVLSITGLTQVAKKRAGGFSLGMGQRLGIASALLGDPHTLILDEPVNGLDPEGVMWVRNLARGLAAEGRTVFLSSHLMSEMAQTADHLVIIGRGRIIADAPIADILASKGRQTVRVATESPDALGQIFARDGVSVQSVEPNVLTVAGLDPKSIAQAALDNRILIYELTPIQASLEQAYMDLTRDEVEYHSGAATGPGAPEVPAHDDNAAVR
ncbi:ABC transporter ATP-binding protein [Haematomicrobium sanguinis]|uniref:ABC transporter ATP-binding protein n=1 Tax=Haematomicrobium sanguinis TaxID=479106 RepID=UPI00047A3AED|nr:ABC transporter ATP-binding protein [Haematomicrobium sanguinis]